jgi:uncharacterized repeat protein (TIGR03803 family)
VEYSAFSNNRVLAQHRVLTLALGLLLGLSPTIAAHAETGSINQLFAFTCFGGSNNDKCPQGARPDAIIQASDGNFYGAAEVTDEGVSFPQGGTLFKLTPSGQFTLLFSFVQSGGKFLNGNLPVSGFIEGNDGLLYGTTVLGGTHNDGVLFRISKTGSNFTVLHNFCSSAGCADGNGPGTLVLGQDGNIYGGTASGGATGQFCHVQGGCGTIFRFTPASGTFTTLLQISKNSEQGEGGGSLILASDGNFYGVNNGTNGGQIFRFTPAGQYTIQFTFPTAELDEPISGITQGANGNFYGALIQELNNQGITFYEVSPDGTGFQQFAPFTKLEGTLSIPSLFLASDGNLWDTNFESSAFSSGTVFTLNPESGVVFQQFPFNGRNGSQPLAGVIQGADGLIYGTTELGGTISGGGQKFADGVVWNLNAGLPAPAPSVALLNPASGSVGSTVLINGNHFIGATGVSFNGASAVFTVLNTHFISATVPTGATTGPITVSTAGGASTSTQVFTVQ